MDENEVWDKFREAVFTQAFGGSYHISSVSELQANTTAGIYDEEVSKMSYEEQAAMLIKQAEKIMNKGNEIARKFGVDEEYDDGDIIWADLQFPGGTGVYKYSFIKAGGKWWSSGPKGGGTGRTWEDLTSWMNDAVIVKKFGVTERREVFRTTKKGNVKFSDA